jgi:hypothetical protein
MSVPDSYEKLEEEQIKELAQKFFARFEKHGSEFTDTLYGFDIKICFLEHPANADANNMRICLTVYDYYDKKTELSNGFWYGWGRKDALNLKDCTVASLIPVLRWLCDTC